VQQGTGWAVERGNPLESMGGGAVGLGISRAGDRDPRAALRARSGWSGEVARGPQTEGSIESRRVGAVRGDGRVEGRLLMEDLGLVYSYGLDE